MAGGSGGCLFVEVGVLLVEGRLGGGGSGTRPSATNHYTQIQHHKCQDNSFLCERAGKLKRHMGLLSENRVPMCIDVFLCPDCPCGRARAKAVDICSGPSPHDLLLEQWTVALVHNKSGGSEIDGRSLLQAIRSQLHFSQLGAWASLGKIPPVCYRLSHPGTPPAPTFVRPPTSHQFPLAKTSRQNIYLKVSVESLPRVEGLPPTMECPLHAAPSPLSTTAFTAFKSVFAELGHSLLDPPSKLPPPLKHGVSGCWREKRTPSPPSSKPPQSRSARVCRPSLIPTGVVDDRLQSGCKHIGKHHCQEEDPPPLTPSPSSPCPSSSSSSVSTSSSTIGSHHFHQHQFHCNSGITEKGSSSTENCSRTSSTRWPGGVSSSGSSACSVVKSLIGVGGFRPPGLANSIINVFRSEVVEEKSAERVNPLKRKREQLKTQCKKLLADQKSNSENLIPEERLTESFNLLKINEDKTPSPIQVPQSLQRKHHLTLPSVPPFHRSLRKQSSIGEGGVNKTDSSSEDTECESPISLHRSPPSPILHPLPPLSVVKSKGGSLLGSFEESMLAGRLKAVREVGGYTADLGASGTFCPRHLNLSTAVSFFPTQGLTSPYMGVAKLSKKGYHIPRRGTVQVTLLNPLGTVIRMFVVPYNLSDIPPNSHTFIRQRTLNTNSTLRYLIHLRFSSSKSGRVFLHTDLKMIIARQYDMDASMDLEVESNSQLRSEIIAPSNPKYSRK